jgi:hypothetical protein
MGHISFLPVLMFIYQAMNVNIKTRNTQALLYPITEVDLNVNTEKTNNMCMFHHSECRTKS